MAGGYSPSSSIRACMLIGGDASPASRRRCSGQKAGHRSEDRDPAAGPVVLARTEPQPNDTGYDGVGASVGTAAQCEIADRQPGVLRVPRRGRDRFRPRALNARLRSRATACAHSGHNSYWYWPPAGSAHVLTVDPPRATVDRSCAVAAPTGRLDNGLDIHNDEQHALLSSAPARAVVGDVATLEGDRPRPCRPR